MIGKKCGMLTIIKDTGKRTPTRGRIYLCKCECGNMKEVRWSLLRRENKPRSCGCSRKIKAKKMFLSHIEESENCWNWTGTLNTGGYGKFKGINASKVMWEYTFGKVIDGLQVLHTCDNRKCVNPKHLFLGTIAENMKDKVQKNRQAKGSKIGASILTEEKVLEIRKKRLENTTYKELSEIFNISFYLVRSICKNRQWKHVPLGEECSKYISPFDYNQHQHKKIKS